MLKKTALIGSIASLGILFGSAFAEAMASPIPSLRDATRTVNAQTSHETHPQTTNQFQRIEQPLGNKVAVTLGGLGLIGLQLWWFLLSKPKSQKAVATGGNIQEITVTVDGGYDPSLIVVQAGKPVRLKFERKDPSSCLEQVVIPDFHIAADLPLNQVTPVEFTPQQPGEYTFTCGMNMFRGAIAVQSTNASEETASTPISVS
ncbi:MAG: cupredoxin domain-containing protein [Goleter apudmare HA4340-LM2]|jgi:plastocyanin domain-containing protein|nr:cupredoxin domain-containing protein [Goleter apudmare HA4340-LM2]